MGSSFKASSEAGTIARSETVGRRISDANKAIEEALGKMNDTGDTGGLVRAAVSGAAGLGQVKAALTQSRANNETYTIGLKDDLKPFGKLNLLDGTLDGKKLNDDNSGAFDRTPTRGRQGDESFKAFSEAKNKSNVEHGFIFAKSDDDKIYAIAHRWNTNDPQGTVGVFKGDTIKPTEGSKGIKGNLQVIGTFDQTPRGLQLAAAACGDAIGRAQGIKQTATLLGSHYDNFGKSSYTDQTLPPSSRGQIVDFNAVQHLKNGFDSNSGDRNTSVTRNK